MGHPRSRFLAWRRAHAVPPGSPCANCGATLAGPWCHECGQLGTDTHRHVWHLAFEAVEGLFHTDGRLFRTLPRLAANPGGLTRDFLAGKRAAQVPPFRLVLVVVLLLFIAGDRVVKVDPGKFDVKLSDKDRSEIMSSQVHIGNDPKLNAWATAWLHDHLDRAIKDPARLLDAMHERAHDFAILMLPLSALILSAIFLFHQRFVLFDHFVFSMHSLAFQGLLATTVILALPVWPNAYILLLASPVHLFFHMRDVYGTGTPGTLLRMAVLFTASVTAFLLLLAALVITGMDAL